jgi:SAM-dependent methyltransferase
MSDLSTTHVAHAVSHEHEQWSDLFRRELEASNTDLYTSYWWKTYFDEMVGVVGPLLSGRKPKVLEAGSGSGKGSILLGKSIDRTFLDISHDALEYAKLIAKKFNATNIKFVEGDIFRMPFKAKSFDLVWNIGVLEHYKRDTAIKLIKSMLRVTKTSGHVVIGVPNFRSPPIIKAKLLNYRLFRFIPGYRLDSELNYTAEDLQDMALTAAKELGREVTDVHVKTIGAPLFVESPRIIVKTIGVVTNTIMPNRKFLTLLVCKLK